MCSYWPSMPLPSQGLYALCQLAHRLRLCIAFSKPFPGYFAAAFDIFCCISAHARRVALSVRSTVGLGDCLCDCARLLELRGSAVFGTAVGGDVACGWCECLRWRPATCSVLPTEVIGDVDRSYLFARDASATISRRLAERDRCFGRAFSWANSNGC